MCTMQYVSRQLRVGDFVVALDDTGGYGYALAGIWDLVFYSVSSYTEKVPRLKRQRFPFRKHHWTYENVECEMIDRTRSQEKYEMQAPSERGREISCKSQLRLRRQIQLQEFAAKIHSRKKHSLAQEPSTTTYNARQQLIWKEIVDANFHTDTEARNATCALVSRTTRNIDDNSCT